jgi:hypothetical protein
VNRATVQDVRDTTKELYDSRVAAEAATAVEQTLSSVEETAVLAKQTADQVPKSAPRTTRGAVKVGKKIKKSTKPTVVKSKKVLAKGKIKAQREAARLRRKAKTAMTQKRKKKIRLR